MVNLLFYEYCARSKAIVVVTPQAPTTAQLASVNARLHKPNPYQTALQFDACCTRAALGVVAVLRRVLARTLMDFLCSNLKCSSNFDVGQNFSVTVRSQELC